MKEKEWAEKIGEIANVTLLASKYIKEEISAPIFTFDDHRYSLNILNCFRCYDGMEDDLECVFFDSHSDMGAANPSNIEIFADAYGKIEKIKDVFNLVEFVLSKDDGNWMKYAIVGNVFKNVYHYKFDSANSIDCSNLILDKGNTPFKNSEFVCSNYVLEIDLDFFASYNLIEGGIIDKKSTPETVKAILRTKFDFGFGSHWSLGEYLFMLAKGAKYITICKEPNYCRHPILAHSIYTALLEEVFLA